MRKTAMQVLLLWLFSTSVFALQQCCEVFVDASSHHGQQGHADDHRAAHDDHHAAHDGHHNTVDSHHEGENQYCPMISADLTNVSLAFPTSPSQWDKKATALQLQEEIFTPQYSASFRPDNSRWVVNRQSIYLDTQRLRI